MKTEKSIFQWHEKVISTARKEHKEGRSMHFGELVQKPVLSLSRAKSGKWCSCSLWWQLKILRDSWKIVVWAVNHQEVTLEL